MLIFNIEFNTRQLSLKNLIRFAETQAITTNIVKEYLVSSLLQDSNVLSQVCETNITVGESLMSAALKDLRELWTELTYDPLTDYVPSLKRKRFFCEYQQSLEKVVSTASPEEMLDQLIIHYSAFGGGKDAQYIAFKWQKGMQGVKEPDDIALDQLFCLDNQKKVLIDNTISLLRGLPANNALLFGDSGSGKSSVVKALLNEYHKEGLRLVEISKTNMYDLSQLIDHIKEKRFKYIVFMDDLSFEKNDLEYKHLKVILDGQIEKQPSNVILYATSNRRNLVNETWAERQGNEVHVNDTRNEKLSLAERFGISVYFTSPDQNEYFEIIQGILARNNIALTDEIKAEAVKWHYNGRSGRTATQFAKKIIASRQTEKIE